MTPKLREPFNAPSAMSLLGVVGWIFADMLLVLVVLFLATQTGGAVTRPPPATHSESPPQPTTPSPGLPPGVDSNFVCLRVVTDPALLIASCSPSFRTDGYRDKFQRLKDSKRFVERDRLAGHRQTFNDQLFLNRI